MKNICKHCFPLFKFVKAKLRNNSRQVYRFSNNELDLSLVLMCCFLKIADRFHEIYTPDHLTTLFMSKPNKKKIVVDHAAKMYVM